jgi:hypothetical protein
MDERYKIHAAYILFILVTIIVLLISVRWGGIPTLADKLSFSLTFASLVVGLLAFAYAVYSRKEETNELIQVVSEIVEIKPATEREKKATSEIVDTFVEKSPAVGLLILYAYSLAETQRKSFDIEELFSPLTAVDPRLVQGYIYAARALDLSTPKRQRMVWR